MPLKGASCQGLTAILRHEQTGIVVVLQIGLWGLHLGTVVGFDHKTGFFEIVIAARDTAGAGFKPHLELPDNRLICHHATVLYVGRGAAQSREDGLIIAKHQHMGLFAMLEVVVNAFFVAEPLNEVQV